MRSIYEHTSTSPGLLLFSSTKITCFRMKLNEEYELISRMDSLQIPKIQTFCYLERVRQGSSKYFSDLLIIMRMSEFKSL